MRGFASRQGSADPFAWCYRKSHEPFEANIRNIGLEGDFYGFGDESFQADPAITSREGKHAAAIDALRNGPLGMVDTSAIAPFLGHLAGRVKTFRVGFAGSVGQLVDFMDEVVSDESKLRTMMLKRSRSEISKLVREELSKSGKLKGLSPKRRETLIAHQCRIFFEKARAGETTVAPESKVYLSLLQSQIETMARRGHNRAIVETSGDTHFGGGFHRFIYEVVESDTPLILGDSGPIGSVDGLNFTYAIKDIDAMNVVYLPLSTRLGIVGRKSGSDSSLDCRLLNEAAASLSSEFFIAGVRTPEMESLHRLIGSVPASFLSEEEFDEIKKQTLG